MPTTTDFTHLTPPDGEHLTTGWEPWLDPGDTLLRNYVATVVSRLERTAGAVGGRLHRTDRAVFVDLDSTYVFDNVVLVPEGLDAAAMGAVVAEAREFYGRGRAWSLQACSSRADLRSRGLQLLGHPPLMFRPAGGAAPARPDGLEVRSVADAATLADFEQTLVEAYPLPSADVVLDPAALGGGSAAFVGYLDGRPVATAGVHSAHGLNEIEWVSTRPEARGRGIGAALTWAATVHRPDRASVLVATDDGRPVYERLGYIALLRMSMWLHSGAD